MSEVLRAPEKGCRDGYRFACGYDCGHTFKGSEFASIARKAARHYNSEHGDDLKRGHERIDTVEYGGHHIHGDAYEVRKRFIYLTPFDMTERLGQIDGWLASKDDDRTCPECHCYIPDSEDRIEDTPDDIFCDEWTCSECVDENDIQRRSQENQQITEWTA